MNSEHVMEWKKLIMIGLLSFASFWAIASVGLILAALMMRGSKQKRSP